jgi:prepilin-type N-terminal cleavage/methylation domain-containing protein
MNRLRQGFTLLELIVVIAVIGILAAITIIGFSQYQKDTRDARRVSSVNAIHEALEKYYDANGEYPSCGQITADGVDLVNDTLAGLDQPTVVAPAAPGSTSNSLKCTSGGNTLTINGEDFFEYEGDGSTTCSGSGSCLAYTLKYKSESDGAIATVTSRRVGQVAGAPSLTVSSGGFTSANISWTAVGNASGYTLQRATNSGFTSNLVSTSLGAAANSTQANGLTAGDTYYFRIRAESIGGSGDWSTVRNITTNALATPIINSAVANSNSQITVSWTDIASETGYTLQYTTSSSSWSSPAPSSISLAANTTSRAVTGLSTGVTYYFRLQATASGDTSDWSPNASATTFVPAPTSMTATTNSTTQITADWSDVSVATSYTLEYDDNSGFTSPASITAIATSSRAVTGLTQGETYWFRAYAVVSGTSSTASPSANATTTISGPSGVGVSASDNGTVRAYSAGDWIHWFSGDCTCGNWYFAVGTGSGSCASGTTRQMRFGANYTSPTTFRGWSGWGTGTQGFMVSPNSPYGIRFHVEVRCVGSDATSGSVGATSGYVY